MANLPLKCLEEIMEGIDTIRDYILNVKPYSISHADAVELFEDLESTASRIIGQTEVGLKVLAKIKEMKEEAEKAYQAAVSEKCSPIVTFD